MNRTQLAQLAVLAAVSKANSFRKAAEDLGVAPSAISHAISSLEQSLGVRLLARTTRSVFPTREGLRLLAVLEPALHEIDAVCAALSDEKSVPSGALKVTMPRLAADHLIAPRLGKFLDLFPEIELEIVVNDIFEDIVERGFDAGLRLGEHLEADMIAVRASVPWRGAVIGAPVYFEKNPFPFHPRDLLGHRCIRRRFSSGRIYRWEFEKDGRETVIDVKGPLILSDDRLILSACIDGAGLAYLFDRRIENFIRDGAVVRALEDWCPPFEGFFIYYPSRKQMRPALRAFIDYFRI